MNRKAYVFDVRDGCVAVYEEPVRNCLALSRESFKYYADGKYGLNGWEVSAKKIKRAKTICEWLNSKSTLKNFFGNLYATVCMISK